MRERYLQHLKTQLQPLNMPIFFEDQPPETPEPFIVIGVNTSDTAPTAKTNRMILDDMQQIDIFLSAHVGRVKAEQVKTHALQLIGRSRGTSAQLLRDDSIGRDVYHVVIRILNYIY